MSNVYTIKPGDTFEKISRRMYGTEGGASTLQSANPELRAGMIPGAEIVVPDDPNEIGLQEVQAPGGVDEIIIKVSGKAFKFWTEAQVTRSIDSVSTFEFSAPFEPDNREFREIFKPMTFQSVEISIGGELVMTGTLVDIAAEIRDARTVTAVGYSKPGVLRDCTLPNGTPLEFYDLTLQAIATTLAKPFGIGVEFALDVVPGPVFDNVTIEATTRPAAFLTKLAQQRNLVIGSTVRGKLIFQRATKEPAIEELNGSELPLQAIDPTFKPQDFYSHVTSLTPSFWGGDPDSYTIVNPNLRGVVRPLSFRAPDTYGADSVATTQAKVGRMYAKAVGYVIVVAGLRDSQGRLWKENTRIRVQAPSAMIYNSVELLIRSATVVRRGTSAATQLRLVLPESFSGEIPKGFPWDS